jgi:Uma2 family endonuclease
MICSTTQPENAIASAATPTRCTPAEYLAQERKADFKGEYRSGLIVAMAGANRAHNLIAGNFAVEIGSRLKNRSCEVYSINMRVLVSKTGLESYPDVVAVWEEPRFEDHELDTLLNPALIVEVLSSSTESYDRGRKFGHYRRLESSREYVIVSEDQILVERYTRRGRSGS